jgi:hypothetical protein
MNRRDFFAAGLSSLMTWKCGYAQRASAKALIRGCRTAAASNADMNLTRSSFRQASGFGFNFERECIQHTELLKKTFGVRPGFTYYEDEENALATRYPYFGEKGPDGTVMLGINLVRTCKSQKLTFQIAPPSQIPDFGFIEAVIVAHEFGHILQFKNGLPDENGPWQMEPHADFMAGWFFAQMSTKPEFQYAWTQIIALWYPGVDTYIAASTLFNLGDTDFTDSDHHGTPEFRARMFRVGYEAGSLGVMEAFEKGLTSAGLKRKPS